MKNLLLLILIILATTATAQTRVGDITTVQGMSERQLVGYGLVIGLDGSGDGGSSKITTQSLKNMMDRFGISVDADQIKPDNVAAVMITAQLPPFAKIGAKVDVTVSSVGNAKSLEGGTLFLTYLYDAAGQEYAIAQGSVSIGGFNTAAQGARLRKNYALVGRVPTGATLTKSASKQILHNGEITFNLHNPDFTTSQRLTSAVNNLFNFELATAIDAASVSVIVPDSVVAKHDLTGFVANIQNLTITPEQAAKVVINERTGTIVAGGNVKLSEVAVSHGNLVIEINSMTETGFFGDTQTTADVSASVGPGKVMVVSAATVNELALALNRIKVSPRDLISIFQALKTSGSLQAELVIM